MTDIYRRFFKGQMLSVLPTNSDKIMNGTSRPEKFTRGTSYFLNAPTMKRRDAVSVTTAVHSIEHTLCLKKDPRHF